MFFRASRWGLAGAAAGAAVGVVDFYFLVSAGAGLQVDAPEFRRTLLAFLLSMFSLLGYALGRLAEERRRARRSEALIASQLASLEKAQRDLVQQEKLAALGRLAAGIAHEMRNPLGVIRSSAAMLKESAPRDRDSYRACQFICEETDRLNAVITSLLDFTRPLKANLRPVRGAEVVGAAVRLAETELSRRRVRIACRVEPDASELRADPDLTVQAILGLVVNAAEAIGEGGSIEISARRLDGHRIGIEVADDGPGVELQAEEQIFEPFYTSKPSGTGLGLPMIRRSVEAQGGRCLFIRRAGLGTEGSGARFRIEIPQRDPREPGGGVAA